MSRKFLRIAAERGYYVDELGHVFGPRGKLAPRVRKDGRHTFGLKIGSAVKI